MNSDRRILAIAIAALATAGCLNQEGTSPPTFPGGGLLARAAAPKIWVNPEAPTFAEMVPLLAPLEGVYSANSRFGNPVVVHTSLVGNAENRMDASLALFSSEHDAFALLLPGCIDLPDDSVPPQIVKRFVFEGYWRYLQYPEPTKYETGLVRLYVSPASAGEALCRGEAVLPGSVSLVGGSGFGNDLPTSPLELTYVGPRKSRAVPAPPGPPRVSFLVGAHHGGCQSADNCGISENTPETFVLTKRLGGDYLEIDVRMTADNQAVLYHLGLSPANTQGIYCRGGIQDWTYDQLVANCRLRNGELIPRLYDALLVGLTRTDILVWLDMKVVGAVQPSVEILQRLDSLLVQCAPNPDRSKPPVPPPGKLCLFPGSRPVMERVIIGLPSDDIISEYQTVVAALPPGATPPRCLCEENFDAAVSIPCQAASPRYTRGPLATDALNLQSMGKFFGYWTINDPVTIDAFLQAGRPNGILTNYLGTLNVRWEIAGILPPYPLGAGQ